MIRVDAHSYYSVQNGVWFVATSIYGTVVTSSSVVVYGTGWYYPAYVGAYWYGWPYTYGYGAAFTWGVTTAAKDELGLGNCAAFRRQKLGAESTECTQHR